MININTSISYFTKKIFYANVSENVGRENYKFFCKQKNPIIVEPWNSFLFIQIRNISEIYEYYIIFLHSASCIFAFVN